jgi:dipeptidyl aminopeptidase/acylaminoacyl peptidase
VNFRGSTGFGKAFVNAADRQWGDAMLHDLDDAAQWAIDNDIADPAKIAILGGHYGGYAALAGLAFTPARYACGVSIGAPSNLVNMLGGMPPYWTSMRDILLKRVGDPSTEVGRRLLEAQSPALHASQISSPLFIAQGANDPIANQSDTRSIVQALKEKGVPVTYVLYPDEGGVLDRPADQASFYAIAEAFLGKCLGGRTQPIGDALKGSSTQIIEGAENIPGLIEAMSRANATASANAH